MPCSLSKLPCTKIPCLTLHAMPLHGLDVSCLGTIAAGLGPPDEVMSRIRAGVRDATGCNVSVGSGHNRLLARIATSQAKPDGQFWLPAGEAVRFLEGRGVRELPGVGWSTVKKLEQVSEHLSLSAGGACALYRDGVATNCTGSVKQPTFDVLQIGVTTVGELRNKCKTSLQEHFGDKAGVSLYDLARGVDNRPWTPRCVPYTLWARMSAPNAGRNLPAATLCTTTHEAQHFAFHTKHPRASQAMTSCTITALPWPTLLSRISGDTLRPLVGPFQSLLGRKPHGGCASGRRVRWWTLSGKCRLRLPGGSSTPG